MIILNSLNSIISIVIMVSIGYFLTAKGWFSEESSSLISKLVVNIALPALMISTIIGNIDREKLIHFGSGFAIPIISMFMCYIIAAILSKCIQMQKRHQGMFISMFFNSNTIFIGLPVNLALFGEKSIPYVLLYYIANTTFFWTLGVYYISRSGKMKSQSKILSIYTLKRIFSPPLIGYIVSIIIILLNINLPNFIMDTSKYMGNLTTPLSMIFIGICIYSVSIKDIKITKDMIGIVLGRVIVSPLIIFLLTLIIPIPLLMKKVFIMQAAMPVMTNTTIVAKNYNADTKYAAVMTVVTTILSIITIPFYMVILNYLK